MVHRHRHVMEQDVMDRHLDLHLHVEHLNDRRRRHHRRPVHHDHVDNFMTPNLILQPAEQNYEYIYRFASLCIHKKKDFIFYICVFLRIISQAKCLVFFSVFVYCMYVHLCTSHISESTSNKSSISNL
jgi:hypothetical protein